MKAFISILSAFILMFMSLIGFTGEKGTGHTDYNSYKNVILFIGDGNGFNTVEATKYYRQADISMETMPVIAQSKTRSSSSSVTDSAAGGTALACGIRTINGYIGVYPFAPTADEYNYPVNLCELAKANGKAAGVVTTDKTSGATPAAFSAHSSSRSNEEDISFDQLGSDLDLIWGSASASVTEELCTKNGFKMITTSEQMNSIEYGTRSFGQFNFDDFADVNNQNGNPYLYEMTEKAIDYLNNDEDGFFLMVEAAHIDKFSHSNNMEGAMNQEIELSKAVQTALDFAEKDGNTLIVVTADHETGGIKKDAETGEFYYTKTSHTGANVPLYVSKADAGFVNGEAYKNCEVSAQIARIMGFDKTQFPVSKYNAEKQ